MSAPFRHELNVSVRSYEVEPDGRIRLVVLARLLQEAAWQHARRLGWGLINRESGSLFWVLSRLRLVVNRYPLWDEQFTIQTWPVGTQRVLAIRDFILADAAGELGRATTGWLVVDESSGRPVRPEKIVANAVSSPSAFPGDLDRIPELQEGEAGSRREVLYHDIDRYRHVNNTAYLEWMLDAIAVREAGEARVPNADRMEIDFLKELTLGEEFRPRIHDEDSWSGCEIVRADDDEVICRARFHWSNG